MKDTVWSELAPLHVSVDFQELEDAFAARQPVKARAQTPVKGLRVTIIGDTCKASAERSLLQLLTPSYFAKWGIL